MQIKNSNKNSFTKKGVDINLLSEEYKKIIKQIPSIDFTYICKKCKNIPKINIEYCKYKNNNLTSGEYIGKILFNECNYSITLNEDNIDNNELNLEKVSLTKLKEENYMNINQWRNNNDNFINFESLDNLNQYIKVYYDYLNIKAIIESYNLHDTKNDKIFTLFENLLLIGFYGYGTIYEYENSIVIKQFSLDKFYMYAKEYFLRFNKLVNINTINIKNTDVIHIDGDENLYALIPYYKDNINYRGCFISKYENFLDKSFDAKKCIDYCHKINSIPKEKKKNILFREEDEYLEDIISLGENKYLIRKERRKFFNVRFDDSRVYTYIFDDQKNEYIIEKIKFDNDKDIEIEKINLFKKNKILVETAYNLYIYEFNNENNNVKFKLIKKFEITSDEKFRDMRGKKSLIEANNGDIIYYYPSKLVVISTITYQIKTIIKLNGHIFLEQISKNLLCIDDIWKFDFSSLCLDINKIKLIRVNSIDKKNSYYLNNNICLEKRSNNFYILDLKLKKIIISRQIDDINIKNTKVFIFNKKENIFGIFLIYNNDEEELMIFQFKLE